MSERSADKWMEQLAERTDAAGVHAPSTFKSKLYSRLVEMQAESTGLASLSECTEHGFGLCVFEKLVQIAPTGESIEKLNFCRVCHARVLGERVEGAPIYWPHCPYVQFQNR
jgi:hypothetical protein